MALSLFNSFPGSLFTFCRLPHLHCLCCTGTALRCQNSNVPIDQSVCHADPNTAERKTQHAAARLRTKQYCDIATLAWDAKLEGLVREACPPALALEWAAEVDPEAVRWQAQVHR